MPENHPLGYWKAVAAAIDAEEKKAASYLPDEAHLDQVRVAILRQALAQETPQRFRVGTGLIVHPFVVPPVVSPRLDVIVHEPAAEQAYYQSGDFALVAHNAARFAFEV